MSEFERAMARPKNYFKLSASEQWNIDANLGILDWTGNCAHSSAVCKPCKKKFYSHFNIKPKRK